jgi:hypothetical protein
MDMIYHLPSRDWMELDRSRSPMTIAAEDRQVHDTGTGSH